MTNNTKLIHPDNLDITISVEKGNYQIIGSAMKTNDHLILQIHKIIYLANDTHYDIKDDYHTFLIYYNLHSKEITIFKKDFYADNSNLIIFMKQLIDEYLNG